MWNLFSLYQTRWQAGNQRLRFVPILRRCSAVSAILSLCWLIGCSNSPYPPGQTAKPILFLAISEDPKTFDPSIGYDVGTALIIDCIYPSFFKYHYLKRDPYVLELSLGAEEPKREKKMVTIKQEDGKQVR